MQITPEFIRGIKVAASMAGDVIGNAQKLLPQQGKQEKPDEAAWTEALIQEEKNGIYHAVYALTECGIEYEKIVALLVKYWDISDKQARSHVSRAQGIEYPLISLKNYLQSKGWSEDETAKFIKSSGARKKLKEDDTHTLREMPAEKLYRVLREE